MPNHTSDATGNKSTEFPEAHKTRLKSFISEYEAFIGIKNPNLKSRCSDLTTWRKDTAKKLMKEDIFKDLVMTTQVEAADWEEAIRRFFTNHYNNTYLAKIRRAATQNATPSFPSNSGAALTVLTERPHKALRDVLRRATIIFPGDLSARELFASENDEAIQQKMEEIRAENPELDLVGGGLRNKALKELWGTADKDLWESKINTLARDINANREQFPPLMLQALQDLCSHERLGSTLMSFTWAFRDMKTDGIKGGQIFAGYDAYREASVNPNIAQPNDHNAQLEVWLNHADAVLGAW